MLQSGLSLCWGIFCSFIAVQESCRRFLFQIYCSFSITRSDCCGLTSPPVLRINCVSIVTSCNLFTSLCVTDGNTRYASRLCDSWQYWKAIPNMKIISDRGESDRGVVGERGKRDYHFSAIWFNSMFPHRCEPACLHHHSASIGQHILFHSKNCPSDRSEESHSQGYYCCQSIFFFLVFTDATCWIRVFVIKTLSLLQEENVGKVA